jgi:hypothetical protein
MAFLKEMKGKHPNIIIIFVPGGYTGVWQPLDVGIQRPMKLSMKRSAHKDIVDEATALLKPKEGEDEVDYRLIKLDTTIGTLCNRCIGMKLKELNLSYAGLDHSGTQVPPNLSSALHVVHLYM